MSSPRQREFKRRKQAVLPYLVTGEYTLKQISEETGIPQSSVNRAIVALKKEGMPQADEHGPQDVLEEYLDRAEQPDEDLQTLLDHVSKSPSPILDELKPNVYGLTPQDVPDAEHVLRRLVEEQEKVQETIQKRYS